MAPGYAATLFCGERPVRDMVILKRDDSHHTTNDILHIGCFGLFVRDDRPQRIGT